MIFPSSLVFTFAAILTSVSAAGPSGTLTSPAGGTVFDLNPQSPRGTINLSYSQVSQSNAQTLSIDVVLVESGGDLSIPLASGLSVASTSAPITGVWSTLQTHGLPCNVDWRLTVTEWQLYNGEVISFQAAAPLITIDCCTAC